ncbi:MAG: hypothetical protein AAGE94_16095 [Acidobacteriota bacterium]
MTGWLGLAALALAWGPNGDLLDRVVERSDELEHRLVPIERLVDGVGPLWIVEHGRPAVDPLFVTTDAWQGATVSAAAAWLGDAERLLPSLRVPRLLVARERYAMAGLVLDPLAVDVYEPFVRALADAQVHRRLDDDPAFATAAAARADERMTDVAARHRLDAFLGGAIDYTAQLVAVSHEIARQERRRLARGSEGLCALLDHPATLFGHWRRLVTEASFPGYAPVEPPDGARSGHGATSARSPWLASSRMTRTVLSTDDKRWLAETLLGRSWTGDPEIDFAVLCADETRR